MRTSVLKNFAKFTENICARDSFLLLPVNFGKFLTLPVPVPGQGKNELNFIFTLHCGASKGFMKALKDFIKPFEASQRSVKIKLKLNFYFNVTFRNAWVDKC